MIPIAMGNVGKAVRRTLAILVLCCILCAAATCPPTPDPGRLRYLFEQASVFDPRDNQSMFEASQALEELITLCPEIGAYLLSKVRTRELEQVERVVNILRLDDTLGDTRYRQSNVHEVSAYKWEHADTRAKTLVRLYFELLMLDIHPRKNLSLVHARALHFFATRTSIKRMDLAWTGFNLNAPGPWIIYGADPRTPLALAQELHKLWPRFERARSQVKQWMDRHGDAIVFACFQYDRHHEPMPGDLKTGTMPAGLFPGFCSIDQQTKVLGQKQIRSSDRE